DLDLTAPWLPERLVTKLHRPWPDEPDRPDPVHARVYVVGHDLGAGRMCDEPVEDDVRSDLADRGLAQRERLTQLTNAEIADGVKAAAQDLRGNADHETVYQSIA